jgi:adenylate kinase
VAYRVGITGSPATGKRSVAVELSKITGLEPFSINDYALSNRLGKWRRGDFEVDVSRLGGIETSGRIVYGHLLPYVVSNAEIDFVAVLRCSPLVLRDRYVERGYTNEKIRENLEAEILGVISYKTLEVYGNRKVGEFDTSKASPRRVAHLLLETIKGNISKSYGEHDWLRSAKSAASLLRILSSPERSVRGKG